MKGDELFRYFKLYNQGHFEDTVDSYCVEDAYFWRPTWGDNIPPFYAWFIKRNTNGIRTHHIHMVENDFVEHWDRLLFRDFLIKHPETAKKYESLKLRFTNEFQYDRVTYTKSKTEFIQRITQMAKEYYGKS